MLLATFFFGLWWLNGPGLRWLGPMVATHFLGRSGIRCSFSVEGSLTHGISISDLSIVSGDGLAGLSADLVTPSYRLKKLIHGDLDGLTVEGLHADLNLGRSKNALGKPSFILANLIETLRGVRRRILPISFNLKNLSLSASRDGQPVFSLASSSIYHRRGGDEITLELGAITDATGKTWPAQKSSVLWSERAISVSQLDPYPGISIRGFSLYLPIDGLPSLESQVHLDDAIFAVTSNLGFTSAKINLREGKLQLAETAKRFGLEIPGRATLTALVLYLDGISPDLKSTTGNMKLLLDDIAWQDWNATRVDLDAALGSEKISLVAKVQALGTELSLHADAPVTRSTGALLFGNASGVFNITSIPNLLAALAQRSPIIDPAAAVPPSSLVGNFNLTLAENRLQAVDAAMLIKPDDTTLASAISMTGRWQPNQPITTEVVLDGLKATAAFQINPASYQSTLNFDNFTNRRIDRWLAIFKVKPGGSANLTGTWRGGGEIKTVKHRGEINFTQATWTRESAAPVTAIGGVTYDWPDRFETKDLRVQSKEQTLTVDAALSDGLLVLRRFLWSNGAEEMAEGSASLPVPQDFTKWREMLANDTRPLAVSLHSRTLSLGLLKQWLPASEAIDPRASGEVQLHASGTYAAPMIDAHLAAKGLRSRAKPDLPAADLIATLTAADGKIRINATAKAADFPAAVMTANLPFRPADWAKNPGLLADESIDAHLDLPRLDLSRFIALVPAARTLSGVLTGNVVASGKISNPELKGEINLTGGGFRFQNDRLPAIENVTATIALALDKITVKSLKTSVAGGSLTGAGSLAITAGKLGNLDFKLRGDHLPVLRNDLLILRTNADLQLQGPWQKVVVTGAIQAVDSVFYRDIELLPIGTPFNSPTAAALPKIDLPKSQAASLPVPFRNWGLNVTVRTQDPFLIRGNLATGEVNGSIRLAGTLGSPLPDGSLKITDFRASLPFSTLVVRSGTVSFTPASGFDPILEIRGVAEPRPYQVTIYAYGRLSNPQLVLTSNPPLPDNEIMTLLATGTTTSGLENPQAASSRALQLLAEELRRGRFGIGKQLRPLLGLLDKVDFSLAEADPYSSASYSTATLSITDRWFLSAGMGAEGDSRVMAIWRLSFR